MELLCPTFNARVSKWIVVRPGHTHWWYTELQKSIFSETILIGHMAWRTHTDTTHTWLNRFDRIKSENSATKFVDHFLIVIVVDFPTVLQNIYCVLLNFVDSFRWRAGAYFYLNNYCRKIDFSYNQMVSIVQQKNMIWLYTFTLAHGESECILYSHFVCFFYISLLMRAKLP